MCIRDRGHKCEYRKQIREELVDDAVTEGIVAVVSKPKFASMMQEKINIKVDTSMLDQEIANHEKQLRQFYSIKSVSYTHLAAHQYGKAAGSSGHDPWDFRCRPE